ncbi:hypothetical protein CLV33_11336 [Jejuia pallidilutea]|uniref:Uncharacterized protein n=1 Tax=Jejuia pallidilutea TaxID=504487 RepID=A0A362WX96_9FLAO|nr:hypothetical protein CLV33_11336 [Jejuia pallidilutea]
MIFQTLFIQSLFLEKKQGISEKKYNKTYI